MKGSIKLWLSLAGLMIALAAMPLAAGAATEEEVNDSIAEGLQYLRNAQVDGHWDLSWDTAAEACLVTLASLNSGYDEDDPTVAAAMTYILADQNLDPLSVYYGAFGEGSYDENYITAICILPMSATRNPAYDERIAAARTFLLDIQTSAGGWGYSRPNEGDAAWADISNTQWSIMGLASAYNALGEVMPSPDDIGSWVHAAIQWVESCQYADGSGGIGYSPGSYPHGTGTLAGIWCYRLLGLQPSDQRVLDAVTWMKDVNHYSVSYNVGWGGWNFYYRLTLAKAFAMVGIQNIVTSDSVSHDWFNELADNILSLQKDDGSWADQYGNPEYGWGLTAAYCILALQTRTLPPDAVLVVSLILESYADLHLYDINGKHTGYNSKNKKIFTEIPGSTFNYDAVNDIQRIDLNDVKPGRYRVELKGTDLGAWKLTAIGTQDGVEVSRVVEEGNIKKGEVISGALVITALEGALTLLVSEPAEMPILGLFMNKGQVLGQAAGNQLKWTIEINEDCLTECPDCECDTDMHGISLSADDLVDKDGNVIIPGAAFTFSENGFDLLAGQSKTIEVTVTLPDGYVPGDYLGRIIVESEDGGTKSIPIAVIDGEPVLVGSGTGTGNVEGDVGDGIIEFLESILENTLPNQGKPAAIFLDGFLSVQIIGLIPGDVVDFLLTLPSPIPAGAELWIFGPTTEHPEGEWYQIEYSFAASAKQADETNQIVIQLTDGGDVNGFGDDDLEANGVISINAFGVGEPREEEDIFADDFEPSPFDCMQSLSTDNRSSDQAAFEAVVCALPLLVVVGLRLRRRLRK